MSILVLTGRILFGGVFVWLGILNFVKLNKKTEKARSKKVPFATLSVIFGTLMMIVGGISIMVDYQTGIGSILLIAFLIPATLMIHGFWREQDPQTREADMIHFFKNLALLGAVLIYLGLSEPHFF